MKIDRSYIYFLFVYYFSSAAFYWVYLLTGQRSPILKHSKSYITSAQPVSSNELAMSLWKLLKSRMFPLSIRELFRPVRWSLNPCTSPMSFGFFCAARPHIHFYLLSDVSLTVEIGLNSRSIIVIAGHVWVSPWPCLGSPSESSL